MTLGTIGLGAMGGDVVRRLLRGGHRCVVHDRSPAARAALAGDGAVAAATLDVLGIESGLVAANAEGLNLLAHGAGAPAPVLTAALFQRFASRGEDGLGRRVLSALRLRFGGHAEPGHGR
jgi:6-phosphogluconate dehydrogenase